MTKRPTFRDAARVCAHAMALLALGACGSSDPFDLDDLGSVVDEVSITLAVSGGIAGVSYAIRVDGASGEVVGLSCVSGCSSEPGDVLLPVSDALVADLAFRLERAGVLGFDGRDFGLDCCDFFAYELDYRRGARSAHVAGGGGRLPRALEVAVGRIHGLAHGFVPALVRPETRETDWPRDAYTLGVTSVDGLRLTAELSYGGGCAPHRVDLVVWGPWLESEPVQINALLTHDDGDDPCDAYLTSKRTFDLTPLREAYERAYGPISGQRPTVLLRLWDPVAASPLGRVIEVRL